MLTQTQKTSIVLNDDVVALQKGLVYVVDTGHNNLALAATVQSNLMTYRYMLTDRAFRALAGADMTHILSFHNNVIDYLKTHTGGSKEFKMLFPNFPDDQMDAEEAKTFTSHFYAFVGSTFLTDIPDEKTRPAQFEKVKYTMLELCTLEEFLGIFTNLVSINQSLLPQDLEVVKWFVESGLELKFPESIPFKENLCTLAAMQVPGLPVKTPTDVLRIAVGMSGGDISLPSVPAAMVRSAQSRFTRGMMKENPEREKFKFRQFSKPERRYLLDLLEKTTCDPAEMKLRAERWIRLGEKLHPGDYIGMFPKALAAFTAIRSQKVKSWYSILQDGFNKSLEDGLSILKQRPGELVRRMDWLIRKNLSKTQVILDTFLEASKGASNKVLYELYTHFQGRNVAKTNRTVMIKGARKKTKLPDLPALPQTAIDAVNSTIISALKTKYGKLEPLGNVYIDPELKKIPLPTNMRSVNFSLRPAVRGQRNPIENPDSKVIRAFYRWTDRKGELDPDLSATFIGKDNKVEVLNFRNLVTKGGRHSGDIIRRPGDNAEYVDIDIAAAKKAGFRYVSIDVRGYCGHGLASMDGMFGLMEREFPESNTTWLPETVTNCMKTESTASATLLSIIDLDTMEYIFLDVDSNGSVNARADVKSALEAIEQWTELPKLSVYHLLEWHATSRGTLVDDIENSDVQFYFKDFSTSYEKTGLYMGV